jgi:hypothetical protein
MSFENLQLHALFMMLPKDLKDGDTPHHMTVHD